MTSSLEGEGGGLDGYPPKVMTSFMNSPLFQVFRLGPTGIKFRSYDRNTGGPRGFSLIEKDRLHFEWTPCLDCFVQCASCRCKTRTKSTPAPKVHRPRFKIMQRMSFFLMIFDHDSKDEEALLCKSHWAPSKGQTRSRSKTGLSIMSGACLTGLPPPPYCGTALTRFVRLIFKSGRDHLTPIHRIHQKL